SVSENGPCQLTNAAQTDPILDPYSWDNCFNVLYLCPPIGVGFSYGSLSSPNQNITTAFVTTGA
ncbi:hypothetical protein K432DRAFT_288284, partial [Lepidopterella palustris CBS 459.81]